MESEKYSPEANFDKINLVKNSNEHKPTLAASDHHQLTFLSSGDKDLFNDNLRLKKMEMADLSQP